MSDDNFGQLIKNLSDGEYHSGESLGKLLGISRAAIWKRVQSLSELGLLVESVRGMGYRIPGGLALLDESEILSLMKDAALPHLSRLSCFDVLSSTNDHLLQKEASSGDVCLSEWQSAGRGRRGRSWFSPFGKNLYLSVCWYFDQGVSALDGLSLAIGVLLVESISELGVEGVKLKWPNDLLIDDGRGLAKLGGILIEVGGDLTGECKVVIGIGLNVSMSDVLSVEAGESVSQPWYDLKLAGYRGNRNKLVAVLLSKLLPALHDYSRQGFAPYKERWLQLNAHQNKKVLLHLSGRVESGRMLGVNDKGALLLDTGNGAKAFNGGEVSVRIADA